MSRAHLTWLGVTDDELARSMLHTRTAIASRALRSRPFRALGRGPTFSFLAARTLFFDDAVTNALDAGVTQVVVVGAGYDTRAWRLARPGARFFEVDHPATQHDKRRRAPHDGPTYVAADLEIDRLTELLPPAGFDAAKPAVFVLEGLTMYLSEADVTMLLADLATLAAPESRLAVNFTTRGGGSVAPLSRSVAKVMRAMWSARGESIKNWVVPDALPRLLSTTGWTVQELVTAPDLVQRYVAGTGLRTDGLNPGAICISAVVAT